MTSPLPPCLALPTSSLALSAKPPPLSATSSTLIPTPHHPHHRPEIPQCEGRHQGKPHHYYCLDRE
ncbi:hypothetical protein HKD37_16G044892 [Glycine soja]